MRIVQQTADFPQCQKSQKTKMIKKYIKILDRRKFVDYNVYSMILFTEKVCFVFPGAQTNENRYFFASHAVV